MFHMNAFMFDTQVTSEGIASPVQLAIDRPSHKFTSFLEKHFGLRNPLHQSNNFVVFKVAIALCTVCFCPVMRAHKQSEVPAAFSAVNICA